MILDDSAFGYSEKIEEIALALAKAQANFETIKKDKTVDFTHQGKRTNYSYANLSSYMEMLRPVLAEQGLAVLQPCSTEYIPATQMDGVLQPASNRAIAQTVLIHESGQWIRSPRIAIQILSSKPQDIMAALTYARRYSLGLIGVVTDEDTDGQQVEKFTGSKDQMNILYSLCIDADLTEAAIKNLKTWMIQNELPLDMIPQTVKQYAEKIKSKNNEEHKK